MTAAQPAPDNGSVGDRLEQLCISRGVTNVELARAAGCTPVNVGKIRRGEVKNPSGDLVARFADYLGVDLRWLQTGKVPDAAHQVESDGIAEDARPDVEFRAFMRDVADEYTDPDDRRTIRRAVQLVLEDLARARLRRPSRGGDDNR